MIYSWPVFAHVSPIPPKPQPRIFIGKTRILCPQCSFHRSRTAERERPPSPPVPVPLDPSVTLSRSAMSVSRRHPRQDSQSPPRAFEDPGSRVSLDGARTTRTSSSRGPSLDRREGIASPRRPPMPPIQSTEIANKFPPPPPLPRATAKPLTESM